MKARQMAKHSTFGNPLSFHKRHLLENGRNNQTMTSDPTRMWSKRAAQLRAYHIVVRNRRIGKRGNG